MHNFADAGRKVSNIQYYWKCNAHSLKANLVNLQDGNKPTLHADCHISTSPVEGVSYILDAWAVACLVRRFYQNLLS